MKHFLANLIHNLKFKSKIILYVVVILYTFITLTGFLLFYNSSRTLTQQLHETTLAQMGYLENNFNLMINSYERFINTILVDTSLKKDLQQVYSTTDGIKVKDEIIKYLLSLSSGYVYPLEPVLYLANQTIPSQPPQIQYISEITDELWYQQQLKDKRNLIRWFYIDDGNHLYGALCCVTGAKNYTTGSIPAYLKISVGAGCMVSLFDSLDNVDGNLYALISDQGTVIWCSDPSYTEDFLSGYENLPADAGDYYSLKMDNKQRDFYTIYNQKLGITIMCMQINPGNIERYISFGQNTLLIIVPIMLLSLLSLLLSANLITKRLAKLTQKVRSLDKKNLTFTNDIGGNDEFGELSCAFEEIISEVKDLIENNKKIERKRFDLEIKMLQAQINPHFLYNALSVIHSLANEIQADDISQAITALADFYRLSLSNGKTIIRIRDELKMLSNYIQICSIRYRNKLNVIIDVDEQVNDFFMPKLILQPFIENSVFHAFSRTKTEEPTVTIRIQQKDHNVMFTLVDNGSGIPPQKLLDIINDNNNGQDNFAISNIDKRLKLLYGDEYGIRINSCVNVGTTITITIPVVTND